MPRAYPRLLGIAAVVFGFGLSEAFPAGDVWKGTWKFELDRQDQPSLSYYDTSGKTIFSISCGVHFEMNAVYPGPGAERNHPRLDHDRQRQDADGLRRRRLSQPRSRYADRSAVFQPGGTRLLFARNHRYGGASLLSRRPCAKMVKPSCNVFGCACHFEGNTRSSERYFGITKSDILPMSWPSRLASAVPCCPTRRWNAAEQVKCLIALPQSAGVRHVP